MNASSWSRRYLEEWFSTIPVVILATILVTTLSTQRADAQEERRVKHILLESKEAADAVRKEIVDAGADRKAFSSAARTKSKDSTTRTLGGDLGWLGKRSGYDPKFTEAAFKLGVGEVSEPVETPFGWHLVYVTDTRDRKPPTPTPPTPTPPTPTPPTPTPPTPSPTDLTPPTEGTTKPPTEGTTKPPTQPTTTAVKPPVEVKRRVLRERAFRVSLETVRSSQLIPPRSYRPSEAVEVNIAVKNESNAEQKFFAAELLPLGLSLKKHGSIQSQAADFSSMPEPASFVQTLKTYEISGFEASLNDYFKSLDSTRFNINWSVAQFFINLEKTFPKVKELPDYSALKTGLQGPQATFTVGTVVRDFSPQVRYRQRQGINFAVFENMNATQAYYAVLKIRGENTPVVMELDSQSQFRAVRHFGQLALNGFYDNLDFFDVKPGDFLLGGDPLSNGTGAPSGLLVTMRNTAKLGHKRGTVSFASRAIRARGPVRGGQIGSIFFVCLKDHPEWDEEHVPFGKVISGIEVLEKQDGQRSVRFESVTVMTKAQYDAGGPSIASPTTPTRPGARTNSEALVKTSKGEITVELFEDTSYNTVANFITLAEGEFFKGQEFFQLVKNTDGRPMAILTGSPTNAPDGGPGYTIRDEHNPKRKCEKGALVMAKLWDAEAEFYEPNSAGSQFFLCVNPIPYYDTQKAFTVFGKVTKGLEILDSLAEGDSIESVTITKKRDRPYTVQKNRS